MQHQIFQPQPQRLHSTFTFNAAQPQPRTPATMSFFDRPQPFAPAPPMPLYLPQHPRNPAFFSDPRFAREVRNFFGVKVRGNEYGNMREHVQRGMKGMVYDETKLINRYDPAVDDLAVWKEIVDGKTTTKTGNEGKAEGLLVCGEANGEWAGQNKHGDVIDDF
jgi:hypothetical protein